MADNQRSSVGTKLVAILTWAGIIYLLAWLFVWLIQRKFGVISVIWLIWFFCAMIVLGGALSIITGDNDLANKTLPWLLFGIAATVMTAIQWSQREE